MPEQTSCRRLTAVAVLLTVAALAACGGDVGAPPEPTRTIGPNPPPGHLTVGSVSLTPAREYSIFKPFIDHLAAQLSSAGVGSGDVVLVDSVGEMAERLRSGAVDLYIDSPVPVAKACALSGAVPFLRRWKQGVVEYHGVLVARRDSDIHSPEDLRGRMIAFSEPFSTSGYLLPKATLIEDGLELKAFEDPAAEVPPDHVGYVLSGDAENTMVWVLKGKVAAGAVNADYLDVLAGERRDELEILMRTIDVPRNVVCRRADLNTDLVRAVERALVSMHESAEGRRVLDEFQHTTRFDHFPGGAAHALEPLDRLLAVLAPSDEDAQ